MLAKDKYAYKNYDDRSCHNLGKVVPTALPRSSVAPQDVSKATRNTTKERDWQILATNDEMQWKEYALLNTVLLMFPQIL